MASIMNFAIPIIHFIPYSVKHSYSYRLQINSDIDTWDSLPLPLLLCTNWTTKILATFVNQLAQAIIVYVREPYMISM